MPRYLFFLRKENLRTFKIQSPERIMEGLVKIKMSLTGIDEQIK